ncbi:MAG: alpha/beta fold hydrolase [Gammaproteobacteria bacterium]|jgi:esterase
MSVKLNFQSYGEGKPLYILHGLFGSNRNWTGIARQLANSFQVITIDLRNHGESEHADSMSYTDMAEDITRVMSSRGHEAISILGHSMGGKTAMVLSLLNPSLVERLIVVDISPVPYRSNHDELISALQSLPISTLENRSQADSLLEQHIPEPMLRQFLLQNLIRDENGFKWRIHLNAIQENHSKLRDFPTDLAGKTYDNPALFISGERSDYIQAEHQDIIIGYFPAATHIIIDNADHWVHADKPAEVIKAVTEFLI